MNNIERIERMKADHFRIVHSNTEIMDERFKEIRKRWEHCTKTLELNKYPLHVDIEITNACNLRCFMCERNKMKRAVGKMDYDLFRYVIEECSRFGVQSVKLNGWGESLLHRDMFRMIEYADSKGIYTQFNTNVTFATEEKIKKLIKAGLHRITLSVESIIKEIYEETRVGASFDDMIRNIEAFTRLKSVGQKPYLTLQIMKMKRNERYIPDFIDKFKDKVDFISITNVTSTNGDPAILQESLIDYQNLSRIPCPSLWQRLLVYWDGDVAVCCADYDGSLVIGNVKEKTLEELWRGEAMEGLRARHKRLDFDGLICKTCTANYKP